MRKFMRQSEHSVAGILIGLIASVAVAPGTALAQGQPQRVVVFGDSLSDPGNAFPFAGTNATPPDYSLNILLSPSAPYARGGHHFSNGPTWIEQLAVPLGATRSVLPAFIGSNPFAMNFAIGTARARTDGINPGLSLLVATFVQKTGGVVPSDALYVVQLGGNDVRDALATGNPVQANAILQAAAASIAANISALYAGGARRFLVWNAPDVGVTPAAHIADTQVPGTAAAATLLTQGFNAYLAGALAPLAALPGIELAPFDANALITSIVNAPSQFGLTNVTDACVTPDDPPFTCQAPDEYLFWDGIHPTAAAHAIIASAVAVLLGI